MSAPAENSKSGASKNIYMRQVDGVKGWGGIVRRARALFTAGESMEKRIMRS